MHLRWFVNELKQSISIKNLITAVLLPKLNKFVCVVNIEINNIDTKKKKYDIVYNKSHLKNVE